MMDLQSSSFNEQKLPPHDVEAGSENSCLSPFFFEVKGFNPLITPSLKNKFIDLGVYPGVRFQTINKIKLSNVIVIRFDQTLVALSQVEFDQLIL